MRYFIDEVTHWDWQGYAEQLQALAPRLSRRAFATLSRTSFHDAQVLSIQVNNLGTTGRARGKDPTEVVITSLPLGWIETATFPQDWVLGTYQR